MSIMKLKYKHVRFNNFYHKEGKFRYFCITNEHNNYIGLVQWYPISKEYRYLSYSETLYTFESLNEIAAFLTNLNYL